VSWTSISISAGILLVQIVVALISYFTIHRHRAVYGMKTSVLRMPHGDALDIHALNTEHIDKFLKDGKYTVLQIVERSDKDLEIILGQTRK
jgi:hypothetical protein